MRRNVRPILVLSTALATGLAAAAGPRGPVAHAYDSPNVSTAAVSLASSQVQDNVASDGNGGGIDSAATVTLDSSQVQDNRASMRGGGIYSTGVHQSSSQIQGNLPDDCAPAGC